MSTKVINIRSGEPYDQYIGRAGHGQDGYFGNPFKLSRGDTRGATLEFYKTWFMNRLETDPVFKSKVISLRNKTLACFCKPNPCHGDIIAQYLDSLPD